MLKDIIAANRSYRRFHEDVSIDQGIAAQSILLGATEIGFGGCMIGSIQREGLRNALSIPEQYKIELVIALGKTKETVIIDTVKNGNIKYWRDDKDQHHVPKRSLDEIILEPNQSIEPTRHDARI